MQRCLTEACDYGTLPLDRHNAPVDILALLLWMVDL